MAMLTASNWCSRTSTRISNPSFIIQPRNAVFNLLSGIRKWKWNSSSLNHAARFSFTALQRGFRANTMALAGRKTVKKLKRKKEEKKDIILEDETKRSLDDYDGQCRVGADNGGNDFSSFGNTDEGSSTRVPSRSSVLQACTVTSGVIAALGLVIRQVSHVASAEGLPIIDCDAQVSFGLEFWHLGLIAASVVLISSSRYVLLKTWRDFSESSEAANTQVLSSLETSDYMIVAFLPGISEELLFRGALLPLFGLNWKSALGVAIVFGILHLGNGRKFSFTIWATFVGFMYGYVTIISSSVAVPMASHALNNLIGATLWRNKLPSSE